MTDLEMLYATDPSCRRAGDGEPQLIEYIERLRRDPAGRKAAYVPSPGALAAGHRCELDALVGRLFGELVISLQAELFFLGNGSLLVIYRSDRNDAVERALDEIRRFVLEHTPGARGGDIGEIRVLDLEHECPAFLHMVGERVRDATPLDLSVPGADRDFALVGHHRPPPGRPTPLNLSSLARIKGALEHTDVANLVRNHTVGYWVGEKRPRPCFTELTVSIADLAACTLPGVDLRAEPSLFRRLSETLDRRMLALLAKSLGDWRKLSINLNIATVMSPEFLSFDEVQTVGRRSDIVIEFKAADVVGSLDVYPFIREYLRSRGYRVCIDGLSHRTFPLIDRGALGADFVKFDFSGDMFGTGSDVCQRLTRTVADQGPEGVILARVETGQVLMMGRKMGIRYFQGNYVDYTLKHGQSPCERLLTTPMPDPRRGSRAEGSRQTATAPGDPGETAASGGGGTRDQRGSASDPRLARLRPSASTNTSTC